LSVLLDSLESEGDLIPTADAGYELTPAVEKAILEWQQHNRMGSAGTHRYTAEEFGLNAASIHSDYDFYISRFDVALEG
jgi:hypothetical protein